MAYHEIVDAPTRYRYHVQVASLREHLALYRRLEHRLATPIRVTFDDGHESHAGCVLDELSAAGMTATFFILAGDAGRGEYGLPWSEIRAIADAGHTIGSHGWSHRMLTRCSDRELAEELSSSRAEIEARIGRAVDTFSFPGGRWDMRVARKAADAGYHSLYHSDAWRAQRTIGHAKIEGRWMVTQGDSADALARILCPSLLSWQRQRAIGTAKALARSVIGEDRYHELWCRLAHMEEQQGLAVTMPAAPDGVQQ